MSGFRLLLGLTPEGRQKRVNFLELEWSYEAAVIAKGYECFLEAGFQTMLQTYIQMRTGWPWLRTLSSALGFSLGKGYLLKNGNQTDYLTFNKSFLQFLQHSLSMYDSYIFQFGQTPKNVCL